MLLVAVVVLAVAVFRILKRRPAHSESYVCDVCGEHECICRKEEEGEG